MSPMQPLPDPYRVLGVAREAGADEIKAAHRRLAKRFHPDAGGDERRFLAVQDAYQLLSDPAQRRDWDRRHAPGPVRARERAGRPRSSAASTRWTREDTTAYRPGRSRRARRDEADHRAEGSGRDPRRHHHTWSAAGVPWWEDFEPKGSRETSEDAARGRDAAGSASGAAPARPRPDFDVYDRSSGAAWSMAARRHFRKDDADLPSRGAFRYRGTQVVTGAEARKVAAEEAAAARRQPRPAATKPAKAQAPSKARPARRSEAPSAAPRRSRSPADDHRPSQARAPVTAPPPAANVATTASRRPSEIEEAPDAVIWSHRLASWRPSAPSPAGRVAAVGAIAAPSTVLVGAGAAGALDGAQGGALALLILATAIAGGAIGRAIGARRARA